MQLSPRRDLQPDSIILSFLLAVLLLAASPITTWWAAGDKPWYLPYLIWLGIIALAAWVNLRAQRS